MVENFDEFDEWVVIQQRFSNLYLHNQFVKLLLVKLLCYMHAWYTRLAAKYNICDRILENSSKSHMKSGVFLHAFNDISYLCIASISRIFLN